MPLWVRNFIIDFVETGLAAAFALTFAIPATLAEGKLVALLVGSALAGALIAAARRAVPSFLVWLKEKLGTTA
jgi:hypothetical protein